MKAAVISDIHGNSPALRAVLEDIRGRGYKRLMCLGDVIAGPDPRGSLELLLSWPEACCMKGNAEQYLCTQGIEEFPWRDRPEWHWLVPTLCDWREAIGSRLLAQVSAWPTDMVHVDAWMVHDTPLELAEAGTGPVELELRYRLLAYHGNGLVGDSPAGLMAANAEVARRRGFRWLFVGHTHCPFVAGVGGVTICNVGSAGMPLDGDPRAAWVSWDNATLEVRRVPYDIDETLELVARNVRDPVRREHYARVFLRAVHWRFDG